MNDSIAREALEELVAGRDLSAQTAMELMRAVMSGRLKDSQIAAVATALRMKGETAEELVGFAVAMREKAVLVSAARTGLVDNCGTGGDSKGTFNISTAAALVAAAMGIPVAKHGNRAVSSTCGSADVLEALGVKVDLPAGAVSQLIDEVGIGFMYAPLYHPAMKHAARARREIGIRTVFNLLGPLTNPARVKTQLVGVFRRDFTVTICEALRALGARRAFVVHGLDGTDEVSITAETEVAELSDGAVKRYAFAPEDAGLHRADLSEIAGGSATQNAAYIAEIVEGGGGPRRDAAVLNAAFVAVAAGKAADVRHGIEMARDAISSGAASNLLEKLREASHRLAT